MSDEFPTADDLLKGWSDKPAPQESKPTPDDPKPGRIIERVTLTPDQDKAIASILSGDPFIVIGITPTAPDTHDFRIAIHGDHEVLKQAQSEIQGLVDRAFIRKGIL